MRLDLAWIMHRATVFWHEPIRLAVMALVLAFWRVFDDLVIPYHKLLTAPFAARPHDAVGQRVGRFVPAIGAIQKTSLLVTIHKPKAEWADEVA